MNDDAIIAAAVPFITEWQQAGHGSKQDIVSRACAALGGISQRSFHRLAGRVIGRTRKKRMDAGTLALTMDDARLIAAHTMAAFRKNGKQTESIKKALQVLRDNGQLRAERIIPDTGEIIQLSVGTVARTLRFYGLHPEQLNQPTPHVHLRSPHANWCWQMDASVCVIYYLPKSGAMIREMTQDEFYAGKPENWRRIEGQMVIRYLITEHRWGMKRLLYVHGAESGENACDHLIRTMLRPDDDRGMLWGVPVYLMVDPGSAQTGTQFKRLCRRLGINLIINKPGNPRAKGQVEQGHNLVECDFESGLKLLSRDIRCIEDLNALALVWQRYHNSMVKHSRHGQTPFAAWAEDVQGHLVAPPSEAIMRDLAVRDPQSRLVSDDLSISWEGSSYSVSGIPDIRIGEKVLIHRNPWREDEVVLIREDKDGRDLQFPLTKMLKDEAKQYVNGNIIGQEYAAPADTILEKNRKEITRMIANEAGLKAAEKKLRKKNTVPLEQYGIDPLLRERTAELPATNLTATAHTLGSTPVMILGLVRAARMIRDGLGRELLDSEFDFFSRRWPEGVPENQITNIIQQLQQGPVESLTKNPGNTDIVRVA